MLKKPTKKNLKQFNVYARYSSMGLQMIIIIAAGTYGGYWLDRIVEWKFPIFIVLCSFISVGVAIYYIIKDL